MLIEVKDNLPSVIEAERDIVLALDAIAYAERRIKEIKNDIKQRGIAYMQENNIKSIEVSDTIKLILAKKKTDRFESEFIFKEMGFTQEQINILPKNPDWKKTQVLANEKICCAYSFEEKPVLELKELNDKFLKS